MDLPRRRSNGRRMLLATAVRRRHFRHVRPRLRLTALRLGRRRWRAALAAADLPRRRSNGRRMLLATAVRRRNFSHVCPRLRLTALWCRWRFTSLRLR